MTAANRLKWSWSLRWIYQPRGEEKVFVVMREYGIHALFDESGTEPDCGACVVAGFSGSINQWSQFESMWKPLGNSPGFHARRFFARDRDGNRVKPYDGWTEEQSKEYFRKLLLAISVTKIKPFASTVDLNAFWELSFEDRHRLTGAHWRAGKPRLSGAPNRPYYLPFQNVIVNAVDDSLKTLDMGVYFSFHDNHVLRKHADRVYYRVKNSSKKHDPPFAERMKGIIFESDLDNIGLQASDLLAYSWYKYLTRGEKMTPELKQAFDVFRKRPHGDEAFGFTKETMEKLLGRRALTDGTLTCGAGRFPAKKGRKTV